nr:MAG TPA: hypothetical protein [Caudoviricetes sp.]
MLKIENVSTSGWKAAIRGMRNPKNSWAQIDSAVVNGNCFVVGNNDYDLMYKLASAGTDHGKFMRMIHVQCDVTAPLYWWKEADQYKVGTVTDSCSTMHKIHAKEFTLDDFSHEHLNDESTEYLSELVDLLNRYRELFLKDKNKSWWWQMIQLLPSSYNQLRTWDLNYAVLQNIYHARRNHKLDEWHTFCDWIESLPYSDLITGITGKAVL